MSSARTPKPETAKSTFVRLLARGFWPVAIRAVGEPLGKERVSKGKEPIGKGWGLERWTLEQANAEFSRVQGRGIGICLGPGRGPGGTWLIDVEGDGPEAVLSRLTLFDGEEYDTMGHSSARGEHEFFTVDADRLLGLLPRLKEFEGKGQSAGVYKSDRLPGLELRLGGFKPDGEVKQLQSVVPPTVGSDGSPRQWFGPAMVAKVPESFYRTLEGLVPAEKLKPAVEIKLARPVHVPAESADQVAKLIEAYCLDALCKEADIVEATIEGGRRKALLAATMNTAGLVRSGGLTEYAYRDILGHAARSCGLPDDEAQELIENALVKATPRDLGKARAWAIEHVAKSRQPQPERRKPDLRIVDPPDHGSNDGDGDDAGAPPPEPPAGGDGDGVKGPDERPAIEISTEWAVAQAEGIQALGRDPDLYSRGGSLVKVVRELDAVEKVTVRTAFRDVAGTPKVMELSESNVGVRLTTVATFYKWRPDKHGELHSYPVGPPPWLVKSIATHGHWPGVRSLLSVAECPFPRPDGSIVETAGFDAETATLLLPSIEFPPVPTRPVRDDAKAAWGRLSAFVEDFPFASEDDKVVWLAGLLTVIARPAIEGPVPGFAVIGNKAATGKGLLIDTMVIPGTGRVCPTSAYPEEKDEAVKVKVAIAKAGKVAVHFDNLDEGDSYGSGPLDSALTSTVVDDRQLGANDSPPLPLRVCWFLSGNNVTPAKDAYRRWLPCHIKTDLEHPEQRKDIKRPKLRSDMIAARGQIVQDALIILRAHSIHGRPHPDWAGFGSFEDWSDIVRGAVWYATGCDCLATQRSTSASSPERLAKVALLEGMAELEGAKYPIDNGVTTKEAIKQVEDYPMRYELLRTILQERGRAGRLASSGSIGKTLSGMKDCLIDGYRLRDMGLKHGAVKWAVEIVGDHTWSEQGVYEAGENGSLPF